MAAYKLNLNIDQGSTFNHVITWKTGTPAEPVDLVTATARMQIRATLSDPEVLINLSSANGGIVLGPEAGKIAIKISAEATADIEWLSAVYDLEVVFANGDVRRLMFGSVRVSQEVTRG